MKNRFDYISRRIGKEALATSGAIIAGDVINPETQYADLRHEPDPARHAERARLELLGRLAATPCLIKIYSQAPRAEDVRACLAEHLAHWQEYAREARSDNHARDPDQPTEKPIAPSSGSSLPELRRKSWPISRSMPGPTARKASTPSAAKSSTSGSSRPTSAAGALDETLRAIVRDVVREEIRAALSVDAARRNGSPAADRDVRPHADAR